MSPLLEVSETGILCSCTTHYLSATELLLYEKRLVFLTYWEGTNQEREREREREKIKPKARMWLALPAMPPQGEGGLYTDRIGGGLTTPSFESRPHLRVRRRTTTTMGFGGKGVGGTGPERERGERGNGEKRQRLRQKKKKTCRPFISSVPLSHTAGSNCLLAVIITV